MGETERLQLLLDATLAVIHRLEPAELLASVTPERIGRHAGYSPSSVRYQLGPALDRGQPEREGAEPGSRWTFDRDRLWELVVEEIDRRVRETTIVIRDAYLEALDAAVARRELAPMIDAVQADLDAYLPGGPEAPTSLGERAYLLAVATCDESVILSRGLRAIREAELSLYAPVYLRGMEATGRRLRAGETIDGMASAVAHLAEGASLERRYRTQTPEQTRTTAAAMFAIYLGFTEPDPARPDAPLRGVNCQLPPR